MTAGTSAIRNPVRPPPTTRAGDARPRESRAVYNWHDIFSE